MVEISLYVLLFSYLINNMLGKRKGFPEGSCKKYQKVVYEDQSYKLTLSYSTFGHVLIAILNQSPFKLFASIQFDI